MVSEENEFKKHRAQPVNTVLGKPKLDFGDEKRSLRPTLTPEWYKHMPKMFRDAHPLAPGGGLVAPERCYAPIVGSKPHKSIGSKSLNRTDDSSPTLTPEWYKNMPKLFRDAHPLAPGGGLVAPERSYAPIFDSESHISRRSGRRIESKRSSRRDSQQWYRLSTKESSLSSIDKNAISEEFCASGEAKGHSLELNFHTKKSKNRSKDRNHRFSDKSLQNEKLNEKSSFTTVDYSQMPEEFRRAHPEASGGRLYAPKRSFAPNFHIRYSNNRSKQRSDRFGGQSLQKKSIGSSGRRSGSNSSNESMKIRNHRLRRLESKLSAKGHSTDQQSLSSKRKWKSGKFRDRIIDGMIQINIDSNK